MRWAHGDPGDRVPHERARTRSRVNLFSCAVALALGASTARVSAQDLDSLRTLVEDNHLFIEFAIPVQALKAARLEVVLDEQGLNVDCIVSSEVRQRERFLPRTVVRDVVRRTLSYSRWYEEYAITESGQQTSSVKSFYSQLDRFRRFSRIRIVDLGILEPDQEYDVRLELVLVKRLPDVNRGAGEMTFGGVSVPKEMAELFRGKGNLFQIRLESLTFKGSGPKGRLFGMGADAAGARARP